MKNENNPNGAEAPLQFLPNVKEHAPPLAGASVETEDGVHNTGDVDDKAASGGCCVSSHKLAFSQPIGYNNRSEMELQTAA